MHNDAWRNFGGFFRIVGMQLMRYFTAPMRESAGSAIRTINPLKIKREEKKRRRKNAIYPLIFHNIASHRSNLVDVFNSELEPANKCLRTRAVVGKYRSTLKTCIICRDGRVQLGHFIFMRQKDVPAVLCQF